MNRIPLNIMNGTTGLNADISELFSSPRRKLILDMVSNSNTALQPFQIAEKLNLHLNTVRDHLSVLVAAGLLTRRTVPHEGRGRPAIAYAAPAPEASNPDVRLTHTLLNIFLQHLGDVSPGPYMEARQMGEKLGQSLAASLNLDLPFPLEFARLAEEWGFDPHWNSTTRQLILNKCPLTTKEIRNNDLIPYIREGVLRGIIEATGRNLQKFRINNHKNGTMSIFFPSDT